MKFLFQKGHPNYNLRHTEETKRKIKEHNARYWLGKGRSGMSGKHHTIETKQRISESERGKYVPPDIRYKYSINAKKHIQSIGERMKRSKFWLGERNPNWRGGISSLNRLFRDSLEYRLWRELIFKRDNYTCQICHKRGGYLHADHIKPFALFPLFRLDVDNGRTLCKDCHNKYGWRPNKN